jgi:hypothetical protein
MGVPTLPADRSSRHRGHVLAARFDDTAQSRTAIEGLQSAGIDGDDIMLLSPFPAHPPRPSQATDRRILRYLLPRVLLGIVVGIAVGVVVGAIAGGVLVLVTAPAAPLEEIVALAAVGAVVGGPLGAYIGFERAGTISEAWSTTFDELEVGASWIGVRLHDPADRDRARHVFERVSPTEVREL